MASLMRTFTLMVAAVMVGLVAFTGSSGSGVNAQVGDANGVGAQGAYEGDVKGGPAPIGGPWLEFAFTAVGVPATGCFPADPAGPGCAPSSKGNSLFVDAPPWTFTAPPAGVMLTVTDAFLNGDVFRVFDSAVAIGDTSAVAAGGSCGNNPKTCLADPLTSSGTFQLGAGPHSITISPTVSPFGGGAAYFRLDEKAPPPDEQINIHVNNLGTGQKQEGTCWRISYGPAKVQHDVVGDDTAGVKPDCGEPSNLKLFDEDPAPGVLLITITSAQRVQFGDIWHVQNSFSPVGKPDPNNYECDLSQGKCEIPKVAVGGLSVDLAGDEIGLPLEAAQSSGTSAGLLAGVIAAISAVAITVTGAAWYARRRLIS